MALTTGQRWGIAAVVSLAAHGVVLAVATRRAPVPEAARGGEPTQFVPIFDGHPAAPGGGSAKVLEPQRAPAPVAARPPAAAATPAAPTAEPEAQPAREPASALAAPSTESVDAGSTAPTIAPDGSDGGGAGAGSGTGPGAAGAGVGSGTGTGTAAGPGAPTDGCRVEVGRQLAERARAEVPRAVRDRGLVGQVVLTFTVGASGAVEGARVEVSSGHRLLDEAALGLLQRPLATDCRGQYRWPFLWHRPARR